MKKIFGLLLWCGVLGFTACNDDGDNDGEGHNDDENVFEYVATVMSPDATDKKVGDAIHIHVNFESMTGNTIHHANVQIYNKADNTVIYSKPDMAHVHDITGTWEFHDDLVLNVENGVTEHTDWVLEAKVWGHEAGTEEVVQSIEFHVHPE